MLNVIHINKKIFFFLALHSQFGVCSNPTVSWRTSLKMFSMRVTYVIKLSKAYVSYKASSNVLKEIVKLTLVKRNISNM